MDARIMVQASSYKPSRAKRFNPLITLPCTAWLDPSPHRYHVEMEWTFFLGLGLGENDRITVQTVGNFDVYNYEILQTSNERDHRSPHKQNGVTRECPPPYTE
jgi:hypothetical protein